MVTVIVLAYFLAVLASLNITHHELRELLIQLHLSELQLFYIKVMSPKVHQVKAT